MHELIKATRSAFRNPAFSLSVAGILALGIGSFTAIFSVVDAVLLRPLPFESPERLVRIEGVGARRGWIRPSEYTILRERSDLFKGSSAHVRDLVTLTGRNGPDQVYAVRGSPELFRLLGAQAHLGRTIEPSDSRTALIGYGLWHRRFEASPDVLGQTMVVNGDVYTVVGVARPDFEFPVPNVDLWIPLRVDPSSNQILQVIARLKDNVEIGGAQGAMDVFSAQLRQQAPEKEKGLEIAVSQWSQEVESKHRRALLLTLGAVGFLLLIACSNAAGLLLGRVVQRQREIAIRRSLGATRGRIAGGLLAEGFVLAALGSAAGFLLAKYSLALLVARVAQMPVIAPHLQQIAIQGRAAVFCVVSSVVVASLCSVAPMLFASRAGSHQALRTGRSQGSGASGPIFSFLIASQSAFAVILLVGSGLLVQSVVRLQGSDKGFQPENVLTMRVPIGSMRGPLPAGKENAEQQVAFYREVLRRIEAIGGVRHAAFSSNLPLSGINMTILFRVPDGKDVGYSVRSISPDYFAAMNIPLVGGRAFRDSDGAGAPPVAIVNEHLARLLYPDRDPIGQPLLGDGAENDTRIVGVAKNTWQNKFGQQLHAEVYLPYGQTLRWSFASAVIVRTERDPLAIAAQVRKAVWDVDPDQPIVKLETMSSAISNAIWQPRLSAWTFSAIGLLALLLSASGAYAVVSYTSELRMPDFGVRIAVGAPPRSIAMLVLGTALKPLFGGLAVGGGASLLLAQFLSSLLYETRSTDPAPYLASAALILGIGALACVRPVVRAATMDPLEVLKAD